MGNGTYNAHTIASISVTAISGCTFTGWTPTTGVSNSSNRNTTVLMSQHRALTANFTGSPTNSGSINIEIIFVAGGTFTMGCTPEQGSDCQDREIPAHQVTVNDFYITKYPITQAQWIAVMGNNNPSHFREETSRPVENINWDDIQIFITNLNHITDRQYRLPTEAEWEYAARGGVSGTGYRYAGSDDIDSVAWYSGNSVSRTWPVGRKEPNVLGIYDMSGNVSEWVNDWYGRYTELDKDNPVGPHTGTSRVTRGGSWNDPARSCRVSNRDGRVPSERNNFTGFRLVLLPEIHQ
jgi:formylglycine-generating enzyme required for sulfatase activity